MEIDRCYIDYCTVHVNLLPDSPPWLSPTLVPCFSDVGWLFAFGFFTVIDFTFAFIISMYDLFPSDGLLCEGSAPVAFSAGDWFIWTSESLDVSGVLSSAGGNAPIVVVTVPAMFL